VGWRKKIQIVLARQALQRCEEPFPFVIINFCEPPLSVGPMTFIVDSQHFGFTVRLISSATFSHRHQTIRKSHRGGKNNRVWELLLNTTLSD